MSHEAGGESAPLWADADEKSAARRGRALATAVEGGVYHLDADARFRDVDDAFVETTGFEGGELLGAHVSTVLDEGDADRLERELRDNGGDPVRLAVTVTVPSGAELPGRLSATPVAEDGRTSVVGTLRTGDDGAADQGTALDGTAGYEELFERIGVPIFVNDPYADEILAANPAGCELLGYDREELLSLGPSACHPDEMDAFCEFVDGVFETGEGWTDELTCLTKDGRPIPVSMAATTIEFDGRECMLVAVHDVTEYKERERRLRESEERYRALAENFPNGVVTLFDDDLEYTLAAGRGFGKVSVDPGGLKGRRVRDVWPEETANALEPALRAVLDGEDRSIELEYEGRRWFLRAVPLTDDGEILGGMTTAIDVTERREAERRLREREAQLSRLMSNIPGMIYRCEHDRGWPMEFASEGTCEVTGYDAEAFESGRVDFGEDVIVEADRERVWEAVQDAIAEREPFALTYRIETADGERRWVADYGRGVVDDGDVVGVEGVITDVTDRKRVEAELEESERRYRTLVENFPEGAVGLFDEELRYTAVGGSAFEELGDAPDEVVGQTVGERYPDDVASELEPRFRAALEGEASEFELEFHDRTWRANVHPIESEAGDLRSGVIMVQDVTERKRRQRALEWSERQYRTLVGNFPNGAVALVDRDLRYVTFGGTTEGDTDLTSEDLEGELLEEALPPRLEEVLVPHYEAALAGESAEFERSIDDRVYRFHFLPVRDDDGDVFAALGMSQDVTERKRRQRRLQDAKAQLEAATEAAGVGTWEWHVPEDRFVAGASLSRLFGVDPEAAREGVSLDRFVSSIYEDDREHVEEKIEAALEDCGEYEAEYRVWNADGDLRWVFARGRVECEEDGAPVSVPGALADITDRKRAERALERTKRQLETLFEVLPVGVVVADADGRYRDANELATDLWGVDELEADGVAAYDEYDGWWADTGEPVDPEEWAMARVLNGEEVTDPDVFEIETADGVRRIVLVHGMPVRDESGEVVRGVCTLTDVTDRREYQRRLEESEQRYRALTENFPNGGVGVYDEDLRYTLVTGTMWDDIDPDAEDLEGRTVREALPEETAEDVEPLFRRALEGETDSTVSTLGGRIYRVWATPLRDADGNVTAGQSFAVDITEQLKRERELEASNERLEQFAYAASHDLQEPLRMVSSYLSLLENRYGDDLDEEGQEFLEFAVDGAGRMREMIEALLEYSRVETRGEPFQPLDLEDVLDDVLQDFRMRIEESGAEVTAGSLPTVEGDASQLRQVFGNLLGNAIEYSGDDPPRVHVDATLEGDEAVVSVADEGIGIDPDHQDRVFEVFQRLHSREDHEGTGIGLALCERIVERHGGDLWVDSERGEGSTFYFTLPLEENRDG
jgi:PAS domain S-box-containing protein